MRYSTLLLLLLAGPALAQAPKPAEKKSPLDQVDGYKRHTIAGFDLLVSKDVLEADTSRFERKPLEVLELELRTVAEMMTPRAVKTLQTLVIWVEWDEKEELTNGRDGAAVAVYYGGHQASLYRDGIHPGKAKTITILRMKSLTAEHQPKNDSGRCVLLHELAHAVHDRMLGADHPGIKAAFQQAMDRKLYDRTQYASTNESEFFAELTCAYFDQLHYYPRTRDDLKKHDPATYRFLELVWGSAKRTKPASTPRRTGLAETNGSGQFDLSVKRGEVRLGEVVHGPKIEWDGKVVAYLFWGGSETVVLSRMVDLHDELAPFGLTIVAGPGFVTAPDRVKQEMDDRRIPFAAVDRMLIPVKGTDTLRSERPPHALVFDPDGTCIFRGSAYEMAPHVRAAVGRRLLAGLDLDTVPAGLTPVTEALVSGQPLLPVLPKVVPLAASGNAETARTAKALYAALAKPGEESLTRAAGLARTDPVEAYILAEQVADGYRDTPLAAKAERLLLAARQTRAVTEELAARRQLADIQKLEAVLSGQAGGFDPADPAFRARNAAVIAQMKTLLDRMKKRYPAARATKSAVQICKDFGVE